MSLANECNTVIRTPTAFRDALLASRYQLIRNDLYPIKVSDGPKLVVHLFAADLDVGGKSKTPVHRIPENGMVPFLPATSGGSSSMTFDGRLFYLAAENYAPAATMLMHSGVVEATMELINQNAPPEFQGISLLYAEQRCIQFLAEFILSGLAERTTGFPFTARIALLDTEKRPANEEGRTSLNTWGITIRQTQPELVLPDIAVLSDETESESVLPEALERMWQAWGRKGSPTYHQAANGAWAPRRPR